MKHREAKVSIGFIFTLIFLMIVSTTTWFALSQIKIESQKNIRESLYTVTQTTKEALNVWIRHKKSNIIEFINNDELISLTQQLITQYHNKEDITKSSTQHELRKIINKRVKKLSYEGYFIIIPNRVSIASQRDSNIGTTNLINQYRKEYLDRVFKGETLFIPTVHSDVPLKTSSGKLKQQQPTIFIASPIFDANKEVIAALTFRLNPSNDFTRITQLGRIGNSGETYAFDEKGLLITNSRFDHQLRKIGLIAPDEQGILSIRIADPGGNMIEGFIPSIPKEKRPLTFMVKNALMGTSTYNVEGYRDYRGVNVVGTWLWDKELGFGIATEIDAQEAMLPYNNTRLTIIVVLSLTIVLSFGLLFLLLRLEKRSKVVLKKAYEELEDKVEERTKEFKESEEKFRTIFESSADALILLDKLEVIDCNESAINMFKCKSTEEFLSKQIEDWSSNTQLEIFKNSKDKINEKITLALDKGKYSFEWNFIRANEDTFPAEVLFTRVYMHGKKIIQGTIRDISERKKAQIKLDALNKELERLSFLDGLTGISNRRMFDQCIETEWAHALRNKYPLCLILIDIDFFKQYNDYYGHQKGDECLIQVATGLNSVLKRSLDLVARYGGEEFVILLPNTSDKEAFKLAKKCAKKIEDLHIAHQASKISDVVTVSMGISTLIPSSDINKESLFDTADKLLYKAKASGRNKIETQIQI